MSLNHLDPRTLMDGAATRPESCARQVSGPRKASIFRSKNGHHRLAVIGGGYWGSKHIRIVSCLPAVDEVVVVEVDRATREKIKAAFPMARLFDDLKAALPLVDSVIIATPPRTHAELAIECLLHGKHVLIEKPIATSIRDACTLGQLASRSNLILMAGHTFEFNPAVRELKRRISLGELGRVYYIHSARLNLGLYRHDVNVVWDLAAHDVSIMNYLIGSVPTTVAAWASSNAS